MNHQSDYHEATTPPILCQWTCPVFISDGFPGFFEVLWGHRDQPLAAGPMRHDARYFIDRQDDGQSLGATGANNTIDAVEGLLQDMFVEKQDRGQSLILRGRRHMFLDGQARQDSINIAFGKLARMPVLMKLKVPANPINVGVFRGDG